MHLNDRVRNLEPIPYHVEMVAYLKKHEAELWAWFAEIVAKEDFADALKLDLLKTSYRLDLEQHPELETAVNDAKAALDLDIPVTLYQAQSRGGFNAALCFDPREGHIVFYGSVLSLLNAEELKALIGHELAHYKLWAGKHTDYLIADRLLNTLVQDSAGVASSHVSAARRYQLYTEIFADRGAWHAAGEIDPAIGWLVKLETGISQVSAASYRDQAQEIFSKGSVSTEAFSHPETYIRTRALDLWLELGDEANGEIRRMIEGEFSWDNLDMLEQLTLSDKTRRLIDYFLCPKWFQTPAVLGHARMFYPDFKPTKVRPELSPKDFAVADEVFRDFLCYLLLDFVAIDPELDERPLTAALNLCEMLGLDGEFEKVAAKELKLTLRDLRKTKDKAVQSLAEWDQE